MDAAAAMLEILTARIARLDHCAHVSEFQPPERRSFLNRNLNLNRASCMPPSTPSSWFLLQSGPGDPAFNMALDEALLEAMPHLGKPVLRYYSWTEPAASFGYF